MNTEHSNSMLYGFLLSDIHNKANHLLSQQDYTLLMQCETLEDLVVRLGQSSYAAFVNETTEVSKKAIKAGLYRALSEEFALLYAHSGADVRTLLQYFRETLMIEEFVRCLAMRIEGTLDVSESRVGFFPELHTLKFSADLADVFRFCVDNCFLRKYISRDDLGAGENACDFAAVDVSLLHAILLRNLTRAFYARIGASMAHMRSILRFEGDRQIIETVMNSLGQDIARQRYFAAVSNLKGAVLAELGAVDGHDEFVSAMMNTQYAGILENPLPRLQKMEMDLHAESFLIYNDISCVYSYLKLKEQEIKNILWIVECMASGRKNFMDHIFTLEQWS
ncbi:V-type proton ATPase subunit d [Dictyocoela roeselum]|nr:V-type proton ATPase subunit d [Dictyocoela roeselum]